MGANVSGGTDSKKKKKTDGRIGLIRARSGSCTNNWSYSVLFLWSPVAEWPLTVPLPPPRPSISRPFIRLIAMCGDAGWRGRCGRTPTNGSAHYRRRRRRASMAAPLLMRYQGPITGRKRTKWRRQRTAAREGSPPPPPPPACRAGGADRRCGLLEGACL